MYKQAVLNRLIKIAIYKTYEELMAEKGLPEDFAGNKSYFDDSNSMFSEDKSYFNNDDSYFNNTDRYFNDNNSYFGKNKTIKEILSKLRK